MGDSPLPMYQGKLTMLSINNMQLVHKLILGMQHTNPDTYATSPLYYTLTARRNMHVYAAAKSCVITCTHPHRDDSILVFPEVGLRKDLLLTLALLAKLRTSRSRVLLARYNATDLERLSSYISKHPTIGACIARVTSVQENIMDWAYPVRIVATEMVAQLHGSEFKKVRSKVRRGRDGVRTSSIRGTRALDGMRDVLSIWSSRIMTSRTVADVSTFYQQLFLAVDQYPELTDGLVFWREQAVTGFAIWEPPRGDTANLYANLCDTQITGLSDYQMFAVCCHLHSRGVRFLNLGGSELGSLDAFKAKYQPVKTIKVGTAEVEYCSDGSS